jgi:hypothetical protein
MHMYIFEIKFETLIVIAILKDGNLQVAFSDFFITFGILSSVQMYVHIKCILLCFLLVHSYLKRHI